MATKRSIAWIAALAALLLAPVAPATAQQAQATAQAQVPMPRFRHVEPGRKLPASQIPAVVRFVVDDSFPPFSYRDQNALKGLSIDVGDAVCRELKIKCEYIVRPFEEVATAIQTGQADAALSGVAVTGDTLAVFDFTAPYLFTVGRLIARKGADVNLGRRDLRIAVAAGTSHEAWLKANLPAAMIAPAASDTEAMDAVRTGKADAAFVDALRGTYWLKDPESADCCAFAGPGYVDPRTFSIGIAIAVKKGNRPLIEALDYGLDRLEQSGAAAVIWRRYFPQGIL
ncbi:MAG: transporter substrate-binding domain-containing protein [Hyphomicrobiales bacterium]